MAFDPEKDKLINEIEIDFPEGQTKIIVSVRQYDNGPKKLQLIRESTKPGRMKWAKLGRLTKNETVKVIEAMGEMLSHF